MTTIAMGAGMMPLALGWGADPSFRSPMAITVIGGLIMLMGIVTKNSILLVDYAILARQTGMNRFDFLGVDEMRHAELACHFLAFGVDVDADDLVGADHLRALDHVQTNAAQAEHHHVGAGLDLGREQHRAQSRGHAAADVADH